MALTVMADVDRRKRGLRHAILPLLREEIIMESWVYAQGKLKGLEETTQRTLRSLFVDRLGRAPAPEEEQAIARRARELSPEQLVEVFKMPSDALVAWLLAAA